MSRYSASDLQGKAAHPRDEWTITHVACKQWQSVQKVIATEKILFPAAASQADNFALESAFLFSENWQQAKN